MTRLAPLLLLSLLFFAAAAHAQEAAPPPPATAPAAAAPPAGGLSAEQIQAALDVLQSPEKRAQMIAALEAMAKALPQAAPASAPSTPPAPNHVSLTPGSLGADFLQQSAAWFGALSEEVTRVARTATHFPALARWLASTWSDPLTRTTVINTAWRLALVMGCGLAVEWLLRLAVARPVAGLAAYGRRREIPGDTAPMTTALDDAREPTPELQNRRLLQRLPLALGRFLLELVPIAGFAGTAALILGTEIGSSPTARLVIIGVTYAYMLYRGQLCVARALLSPTAPALRLLHLNDSAALYAERWIRRLLAIAVFGGAAAYVALLLGLNPAAHDALVKLISLAVHVLLALIVLQCRDALARRIRARPTAHGGFATLRNFVADRWHYLAIFLLAASWVVWAMQIRDGFSALLQLCAVTLAVLILARLLAIVALGALDRVFQTNSDFAKRHPGLAKRIVRYHRPLRATVSAIVAALALVALLQGWGIDVLAGFTGNAIGRQLLSAAITIALAAAAAILVWEAANGAIDRHMTRLSAAGQQVQYARLRTLLPILRTALLIVILTVVGLTALSEIGVNIAPLLAGAGIVGIAVGVGSQKLVQDLITGLFLLLENAMQVGDWIIVSGGLSGSVENLSIRSMRLRAGDGSVHIIPFSSVTTVTNTNRGIGNAAVKVSIARQEDSDRVGAELAAIAKEMRREPAYQPLMLGDLDLWGVTKVGAWAVTLEGQIVCTAAGRWPVEREFNRRLKRRFDELRIRLADPL